MFGLIRLGNLITVRKWNVPKKAGRFVCIKILEVPASLASEVCSSCIKNLAFDPLMHVGCFANVGGVYPFFLGPS